MRNKPPKQHKCKECGAYYIKKQSTQQVCSMKCAIAYSKRKAEEKRKKQEKSDRLEASRRMRERKEKLKSRSDWLKDLQRVFNEFIRLRDVDLPCISCGRYHQGQYHAGHYRSVGACPELRFNEDNVHKQCSACNSHLSGNILEYRLGLIEKIGLERVEFLERKDHPPLKLSVEEIKALIKVYRAKVRELKRGG